MQLDKTYIAIRERDMLDILDLSLHVIWALFRPLLITFAVGVAPLMLFQHWMLGGFDPIAMDTDAFFDYEDGDGWWETWTAVQSIGWVIFLAPLAAVPTTLYLGQVLFLDRADAKRVARDWIGSLPQLILLQGVIRALLFVPFITCFVPFVMWPYLTEIILLERTPLFGKRKAKMTTLRRSSALHRSNFGDLFARWMASAAFAIVMATLLYLALRGTKMWLTSNLDVSPLMYLIFLEISLWTTACFFFVVRFLSYLDLRIRREGWEVELKMRAEGAHLVRQLV